MQGAAAVAVEGDAVGETPLAQPGEGLAGNILPIQ